MRAYPLWYDLVLFLAAAIVVPVGLYMTATGRWLRDQPGAEPRRLRWFGCTLVLWGFGLALIGGLDYRLLGTAVMILSGLGGLATLLMPLIRYGAAPQRPTKRFIITVFSAGAIIIAVGVTSTLLVR